MGEYEEVMDLIRRICENPPDPEKLAAAEAARTDPWRWYCRTCGERGEAPEPGTRDEGAAAHLASTPCGRHAIPGRAEAGRLLHVWTYPG